MGLHVLTSRMFVQASMDEAWDFFSRPENLRFLTPPNMGFVIKGTPPTEMYPGLFIQYTVKPLLGIPLTWVTEITHMRPRTYFADEQRMGPYRIWHHEHFFEEKEGGVLMTDRVNYALPLGPLGELAHELFVRRQLTKIFDYRAKKIQERWPHVGVESEKG